MKSELQNGLLLIRVLREGHQVIVSLSRPNKATKSFTYVYLAVFWRYMSVSATMARVRGGGDGLFCSKMAPVKRPLSKFVYWALCRIVRYTQLENASIRHNLPFLNHVSAQLGCYIISVFPRHLVKTAMFMHLQQLCAPTNISHQLALWKSWMGMYDDMVRVQWRVGCLCADILDETQSLMIKTRAHFKLE